MLTLIALSMAASVASAPAPESPARRFDAMASAGFTATARIVRGAGIGRDLERPDGAHLPRVTTVEDAVGQPHPALIYDFE